MSVLVVGGSGILAPAALALAAAGEDVVVLARESRRLAQVVSDGEGRIAALPVDHRDARALSGALSGRRFASALLYCPTAPPPVQRRLTAAVSGRVVVLLTSAAAAPGAPARSRHEGGVHLLLGWHEDASGTRWHTPQEVSDAALTALASGQDAVLGCVRPWSARPR